MKKVAVAYYSKYGTTEKYAKHIAEETGADLFDAQKLKGKELSDYDILVFGGGIYGGGIKGLDLVKKNIRKAFAGKEILCFAVGVNIDSQETRSECDGINFVKKLEGLKCYYLPGAFDPEVLSGMDKGLIGFVKKMISEETEDGRRLMGYFRDGCDLIDMDRTRVLIEKINQLKSE